MATIKCIIKMCTCDRYLRASINKQNVMTYKTPVYIHVYTHCNMACINYHSSTIYILHNIYKQVTLK